MHNSNKVSKFKADMHADYCDTHKHRARSLSKRKYTMNIMRKKNYVMCFVIQNMHCFFPTSRETGGPRDGYGIGAPCGTTVRDIPYHGHHDR